MSRDPVWDETFIVDMPPIERTKLELTVWDHDLGGLGNDFWGRVEFNLRDVELPLIEDDAFLLPLLNKKGELLKDADGTIAFAVHKQGREKGQAKFSGALGWSSRAQELIESGGESLLDDQEEMSAAMDRKALFMHEAIGRLNRLVLKRG